MLQCGAKYNVTNILHVICMMSATKKLIKLDKDGADGWHTIKQQLFKICFENEVI